MDADLPISDLPMPEPPTHAWAWERIAELVYIDRSLSIAELCAEFVGWRIDIQLYPLSYLHHVAVYLGDYLSESQVDDWHGFLLSKAGGELLSVDRGPSYIAPRYYGTPGWWFSVARSDGFVLEMFCNRYYGPWSRMSKEIRSNLMSHKALSVTTEDDVRTLLERFAAMDHIETIAYTPKDAAGHTYGHLRNNANSRVLEFVYAGESCIASRGRPNDVKIDFERHEQ